MFALLGRGTYNISCSHKSRQLLLKNVTQQHHYQLINNNSIRYTPLQTFATKPSARPRGRVLINKLSQPHTSHNGNTDLQITNNKQSHLPPQPHNLAFPQFPQQQQQQPPPPIGFTPMQLSNNMSQALAQLPVFQTLDKKVADFARGVGNVYRQQSPHNNPFTGPQPGFSQALSRGMGMGLINAVVGGVVGGVVSPNHFSQSNIMNNTVGYNNNIISSDSNYAQTYNTSPQYSGEPGMTYVVQDPSNNNNNNTNDNNNIPTANATPATVVVSTSNGATGDEPSLIPPNWLKFRRTNASDVAGVVSAVGTAASLASAVLPDSDSSSEEEDENGNVTGGDGIDNNNNNINNENQMNKQQQENTKQDEQEEAAAAGSVADQDKINTQEQQQQQDIMNHNDENDILFDNNIENENDDHDDKTITQIQAQQEAQRVSKSDPFDDTAVLKHQNTNSGNDGDDEEVLVAAGTILQQQQREQQQQAEEIEPPPVFNFKQFDKGYGEPEFDQKDDRQHEDDNQNQTIQIDDGKNNDHQISSESNTSSLSFSEHTPPRVDIDVIDPKDFIKRPSRSYYDDIEDNNTQSSSFGTETNSSHVFNPFGGSRGGWRTESSSNTSKKHNDDDDSDSSSDDIF